MSAERLALISVFQEAAQIELDAMRGARDAIRDLVEARAAGAEYPRLSALNAEIRAVESSVLERDRKVDTLQRDERSIPTTGRLALLLKKQDSARGERADLEAARDAILRVSDDAGQADLDDEQDRAYRALTAEIASIDEEVETRDKEIETLAALAALDV